VDTSPRLDTPSMVAEITARLGDTVTAEQVSSVLDALNAARDGDPVGTVRRDPDSGAVAHRVDAAGVHMWRVSQPDGGQYNDMRPAFDWPELH
jgi:hypothetical protein